MEVFTISCTTCQARLKVRRRQLIGQILPCPKCAGMVLVQPPDAVAPSNVSDGDAGSAGPPLPPSDSFDNIDRLLDGTVPVAPTPSQRSVRWRTTQDLPTSQVKSATDVPTPALPTPAVPTPAGSTPAEPTPAEPTPAVPTPAESAAKSEVDPVVTPDSGAEAAPSVSDAAVNGYLPILFGALIGVGMAAALAGWLLLRPNPDAHDRMSKTSQVTNDGEPAETRAATDVTSDGDSSDADSKDDQGESRAGAAGLIEDNPLVSQPSGDPSADTPTAIVEGPSIPDPTTIDQPPEAVAEEAAPPEEDQANYSGDNELADFARWLQTAEAPAENGTQDSELLADPPPTESLPAPIKAPVEVAVQPTRTPPPPVNVKTRLAEQISGLQLQDAPLIEVLRVVSSLSGIPITLDPEALGRRNRRADFPVRLAVQNATVDQVLQKMLGKTGLTIDISDGQLRVTTASESRGEMVTIRHEIADLVGDDPNGAQDFATWLERLFEPGSWGGADSAEPAAPSGDPQARCRVDGSTLVVTHRDGVQFRILAFFERLRVARGLDPRTKILRERIGLGDRAAACSLLDEPVTLRLWRERDLHGIVSELEASVPLRVLIDWSALYTAGWTPADRLTVLAVDRPLRDVLYELLAPRGLAVRVLDPSLVEITSEHVLDSEHVVEIYPIDRPGIADQDVISLSQEIAKLVGVAAFPPDGAGAILFDAISPALIVSLPQPQQALVSDRISQWRTRP